MFDIYLFTNKLEVWTSQTLGSGETLTFIFHFSVFEYVPDSEEASQSQTESVVSSGSHHEKKDVSEDELEFLERTQAFIANMQKLRQEIRDEQVEEEEIEMTEHHEVRGLRVHSHWTIAIATSQTIGFC